jgi:hypothetical protein
MRFKNKTILLILDSLTFFVAEKFSSSLPGTYCIHYLKINSLKKAMQIS